ncbi:MAG: 50S ribosomal protein L10 [Armatimonadetes bacterium]|nr:50S ribosomal protein L10 [Armatimonadota bacterium]
MTIPPNEEKKQLVAQVRERLADTSSIYLMEFPGLTVAQISELRRRIIDAGGRMYVIKNRLFKRAIEGTEFEPLADVLIGPNAATFCGDDPIGPLKALAEFLDENEMPPVKAGLVEGRLLSDAELDRLSKIPGRDELIAMVVGGIGGPVTDFVFTINALVSDLVYTLQAVADKKGEEGAAA